MVGAPSRNHCRRLAVLVVSFPWAYDFGRLVQYDYLTVHSADADGPPSLHPPLLAYWKPGGEDDDLRSTDLKEMFYRYLLGLRKDCQVIIVENEHSPKFVSADRNVIVFTKNPQQCRYRFFQV